MAFTVTARQSGNSGTTSQQTLTTSSTTPTASSLFLVCSACENDGHTTAQAWQSPSGGSLSYTQIAKSTDANFGGGIDTFKMSTVMHRADVGGSPSAFTVTVDAFSGTNIGFYGAVCLDITGHSSSTPVQFKANGADLGSSGDSHSGTVTFDGAVTAGNLIVVLFGCGEDAAGAKASPTAGAGKTFTTVVNQSTEFCPVGVFYRVADGGESTTITCSDLGQQVGNYGAIAIEVAAAAGGGGTPVPPVRPVVYPRPIIW